LRELTRVASDGYGHISGFHPEGTRTLNEDTYSFLPAQPGIGKVILIADPQVIPVFIAGLGNDLPKQILGNWTGGEKVRIWFGEPIDLSDFHGKRDSLRTHKEISDHLMSKIAALGDKDREWMSA
jgi:1-acyl-sn-glycerol-3-phosphate acyltransferase